MIDRETAKRDRLTGPLIAHPVGKKIEVSEEEQARCRKRLEEVIAFNKKKNKEKDVDSFKEESKS